MDTHRYEVREISKQVKGFDAEERPFRIFHGFTHSTRAMHDPRAVVHTGDLQHILDINIDSRFAMVEPNVTIESLVKETLKHNLMPPVVPPLPDLTVGGVFSGTANSSSSFKYGLFERAVTWVEAVLPDGKITRASRLRNPDLLTGLAGTMGTIGIVTLLQIRLVPAARFVELTYTPLNTAGQVLDMIKDYCEDPENDFIEGLVYGLDAPVYGVVVMGRLCAYKTQHGVTFSQSYDPWFYIHAQKNDQTTECIPILEYLFRYNRGTFCMGRYCFSRIPFNERTRWMSDSATRSRNLIQSIQSLHWTQHFIIQDLVIPMQYTNEALEYLSVDLPAYPLFLSPVRQYPSEPQIMHPNPHKTTLSMHVGIRGYTPSTLHNPVTFEAAHRQLQSLTQKLGGFRFLHSLNYYDNEEQFWEDFHKEGRGEYKALRREYGAEHLADMWEKCRVNGHILKEAKANGFWNRVFKWSSVVAAKEMSAGAEGKEME